MLFAEQVNVLWLVQVLRAIGGSLEGRSHFSVVTFVFVILGLLDVEPLRRHLRRMGDGTVGATAIGTRWQRLLHDCRPTCWFACARYSPSRPIAVLPWADTTTPHGRLMLTVRGGLAEFEIHIQGEPHLGPL